MEFGPSILAYHSRFVHSDVWMLGGSHCTSCTWLIPRRRQVRTRPPSTALGPVNDAWQAATGETFAIDGTAGAINRIWNGDNAVRPRRKHGNWDSASISQGRLVLKDRESQRQPGQEKCERSRDDRLRAVALWYSQVRFPNGNGGGKETTELQDQDFVKQHGMHWYDFTGPDACACSVKK